MVLFCQKMVEQYQKVKNLYSRKKFKSWNSVPRYPPCKILALFIFFLCEANKKAPKNHLVFYEVVFSTFLVPFSAGVGVLIINELQNQKGTKKGRKGTKKGEKRNQKGENGTFQEQKKRLSFLLVLLFFYICSEN